MQIISSYDILRMQNIQYSVKLIRCSTFRLHSQSRHDYRISRSYENIYNQNSFDSSGIQLKTSVYIFFGRKYLLLILKTFNFKVKNI